MANKIQVRRDTANNWYNNNTTLSQGEFGYEVDTGKLKIGNGTSNWRALDYFAGSGGASVIDGGGAATVYDNSNLALDGGNA